MWPGKVTTIVRDESTHEVYEIDLSGPLEGQVRALPKSAQWYAARQLGLDRLALRIAICEALVDPLVPALAWLERKITWARSRLRSIRTGQSTSTK